MSNLVVCHWDRLIIIAGIAGLPVRRLSVLWTMICNIPSRYTIDLIGFDVLTLFWGV